MTTDSVPPDDAGFLGHPRGMPYIVGAEAMDAFSFYGMQALLVLYMTKYLLLPAHAGHVAGLAWFRSAIESVYGPLSCIITSAAPTPRRTITLRDAIFRRSRKSRWKTVRATAPC